jgi:hypothetical protein
MSVIQMKNESFDLDSRPELDTSIANTIYRRYNSDTNITANTTDIVISCRDIQDYFSLKRSYLEITGSFATPGGSELSSVGAKVALENGVASIFSQSRLRLGNILVEDNQALSHVNSFVKNVVNKSKADLETKGRAHGWALDTTSSLDEAEANKYTTQNHGYVVRRQDASGVIGGDYPSQNSVKKVYTLPLCDLFSCCDVDKIMKGISVRVELSLRQALERVFQVSALDTYNVQKVDLMMCILIPTLNALPALESRFASDMPIEYTYPNFKTFESPVVNTPSTMQYSFQTQSQLPLACFVGIQQVAGSTANFFNTCQFDRANVSSLKMKVNGVIVPYEAYTTQDFSAGGDWMRVYEELTRYNEHYKDNSSGLALTPEEWYKTTPLYYLDLSTVQAASSYQLTVETSHSPAPVAIAVGGDANARSANCKILLTIVSLSTLSINPGSGMASVKVM